MAKRQKNGNRGASAQGQPAAARDPQGPSVYHRLARLFGPPILSALVLTLAFPPTEVSWLAYVALVPLLVTTVRARSRRDAFWSAFAAGLVFFGYNLHWFRPVATAGYLALVPYLALYWAFFSWGVWRIGRATRLPLTVLAPVVWVALEMVRGWMLSGLPWLFIGHTQYENLVLIQTADVFGVYGVSFLCVLTAGLVADLLVRPLVAPSHTGGRMRFSRRLAAMVLVVLAAWAGTIGYGLWRLGQSASRPGPVVASVQTVVPQDLKRRVRHESVEEIEERMLADQEGLTNQAVALAKERGLKIDLTVWPETMVPGTLNREFLEYDLDARMTDRTMRATFKYHQGRSRGYWQRVREKAREVGAPVLFGAIAVAFEGAVRLPGGGYMTQGPRYNTACLVSPESTPYAADHTYAKVHLVPFGEFLPFKSWPWLYKRLQSFTPFSYDYSLTPGKADQAPFTLRYDGGEARFQVPICYEDAMAYRVREMVRPADGSGRKAVDFLVNISNDGWFNGSIELDQHLNLCVFRAVENRVAIVRSVNTGISALIRPDGRIEQTVQVDGRRRNVSGRLVGRLTLDDRVAPYTRLGDAFALACVAATVALTVVAVLRQRRNRKETVT